MGKLVLYSVVKVNISSKPLPQVNFQKEERLHDLTTTITEQA
jgi:hypothetical protein